MAKKASVPSPEDPSVRRSYLSPDKLVDRPEGYGNISTVYDGTLSLIHLVIA